MKLCLLGLWAPHRKASSAVTQEADWERPEPGIRVPHGDGDGFRKNLEEYLTHFGEWRVREGFLRDNDINGDL